VIIIGCAMQILFQILLDPIYLPIYHLCRVGKLMMISPSHLKVQNIILELGCKFKFTCDKKMTSLRRP
jgi:hypothetical protein